MTSLYHYTCSDGLEAIAQSGWHLRPNRHPLFEWSVVWLTDMALPDRHGLGLTSFSLSCDRIEHRLTVADPSEVEPWWKWCRRRGVTRSQRDGLELIEGAQPMRWFVSESPVAVLPQ